jgi:hypothetical protein
VGREGGLGEILEAAIFLIVFLGIPILRKLAQRGEQKAGQARRRAPRAPPARDPAAEQARRAEELRRGRDLFETLRRGSGAPGAEPTAAPAEPQRPPAIPWLEPAETPPREPEGAPPESAPAGSLAGMESPPALDEESAARAAAERARELARAWEAEGRAVEERAGAEGAGLGLELAVAADFGTEIGAEAAEPPGAAGGRRFELSAAVLAAEILGPPLALRDGLVGPSSPPGLPGS